MHRPPRIAALAVLIATVAVPSLARADEDETDFDVHRWEVTTGGLIGGFSVGPVGGFAGGMHLDVGRSMKNLFIYGEYDFLSIGESPAYDAQGKSKDTIRGQLHRVSANARYRGVRFGGHSGPVQGSVWIEGGLGNETILWNEGGRLDRRDLSFGLGLEVTFKVGEEHKRFVGFYYAFRGLVADAPGGNGPEMCAGPCDEATGRIPYDLGAFFNLGLTFGF